MAAVSAWSKPGAWALDAEENEAELLEQHKQDSTAGNGHSNGGAIVDFPSLSAAAATKTKKKKPQTLSLQEFKTYGAAKAAKVAAQPKGLTADELMALPTGPRERSAEELDRNRLGGGFRSYGGGMRDRDEQPRRNRDSDRDFAPSRADETDNWATGKKSSIGGGFERRERGGGAFFSDSQSKADEVDNWASKKSFVSSEPRRYERRGSFGLESSNGGADSGNWSKRKEEEGGRRTGGAFDSLTERRGGVFESDGVDSESWGRKREEGNDNGNGGRPKLNLQPRTKPLAEEQKSEFSCEVKLKGSNPFGAARPREEVLKEKGLDWKEVEEKLESSKIKDVSEAAGDAAKRGFWGANARERFHQEDKSDRAWRKPDSVDSRPQSAAGSENGHAENTENGHAED